MGKGPGKEKGGFVKGSLSFLFHLLPKWVLDHSLHMYVMFFQKGGDETDATLYDQSIRRLIICALV